MSRPFSPSGASDFAPSSSSKRITRNLAVQARVTAEGVASRLYCKISLPTSTSPSSNASTEAAHHLLHLLPLSHLVSHSIHPLPLHPGDANEAIEAARVLGLTASQGGQNSVGRRRSLSAVRVGERRKARIEERGGEILVVLLPSADEEDEGRPISPAETERPTSRQGDFSPTPSLGSGIRGRSGSADFLVVLEIETSFGALKLPKFAITVLIPTPLCLRNTLSFNLFSPPASSPSRSWDLSVRPSLTDASSTASTDSTTISGSFSPSASLSLRWTSQLPPGEEARLVIPRAAMDVQWSIEEDGGGKAEVEVHGSFESASLREKQWVEVEIGISQDALGTVECEGTDSTPVLGWEVVEPPQTAEVRPPIVAKASSFFHPPHPPGLDDFSSPLDDSLLSLSSLSSTSSAATAQYPFTPTPISRRRPPSSTIRANEPRPPSFTSLFDTAPPAALGGVTPAVDGDISLLDVELPQQEQERDRKGRQQGSEGSSLLGQEAPFDAEASAMDMSFEVGSSEGESGEEEDEDEADEADEQVLRSPAEIRSTMLRVQVDLGPALRHVAESSDASAVPSFSFTLHLHFSSHTLVTPSRSQTSATPLRLSLPTFAIPAAIVEETVVSVSAPSSSTRGKHVELLPTSLPPYRIDSLSVESGENEPPPSPLPGVGGKARWSTVRGPGDLSKSGRTRKISGPVEVEVVVTTSGGEEQERRVLPSSEPDEEAQPSSPASMPASPADELSLPRPSTSAASTSSFGSSDASSSPPLPNTLSLVTVHITPVPPSSPSSPWRFFHRLTFSHPQTRPFAIVSPAGSSIEVVHAWNAKGETVRIESQVSLSHDGEGGGEVRVSVVRRRAVKELLYIEEHRDEGELRVGKALPKLESKVARFDVEVAATEGALFFLSSPEIELTRLRAGYILDTSQHAFDLVSAPSPIASTTFTRFLVSPSTPSSLGTVLRRSSSTPPALPIVPFPSPSSIIPAASPTALRNILRTLVTSLLAIVTYHLLSQHLDFNLASLPRRSSSHLASQPPSPSLTTSTFTHTHPITSYQTVTSTSTTTSTMPAVSTFTQISISTSIVFLPSASSPVPLASAPTPIPSPPTPAPSASPSPSPTFIDDFPPPFPSPQPSSHPIPTFALDLEDTARTAAEALRVWLGRAKTLLFGRWIWWLW